MANDPKIDLIYAILAMDSYNRGYGSGINDLNTNGPTAKVGGWSIITTATDELDGSFTAGFYAIAYKNGDDTVIAYRGTDNKGIMDSEQLGQSDPLFGYGLALGWTGFQSYSNGPLNQARITTQSRLAADFYRAVTNVASDGDAAANVTLTGHSLGGGLAGYIGDVSGTASVMFDNMPYGIAANRRLIELGKVEVDGTIVTTSGRSYYTNNEFLRAARLGNFNVGDSNVSDSAFN